MAHKLVTFERNGGYAARCEEPGCDAITFGGFASRTAAREALRAHEKTSGATVSAQEKAPAELQLAEADQTPEKGNLMNTTIVQPTFKERRDAAFAPIVSEDDPRYAELEKHIAEEGLGVDLALVDPTWRGAYYGDVIFGTTVPSFDGPAPAWADESTKLDPQLEAGTLNPAGIWSRTLVSGLRFQADLSRFERQDPETREVELIEEVLCVSILNASIDITRPEFAREYGNYLIAAADAWERIIGEAGA